jgi:hypothetical protein
MTRFPVPGNLVETLEDAQGSVCLGGMSPTVLRVDGFRFFFYSREEERPHVHVERGDGEAKIWLEPTVALARSQGLSPRETDLAVRLAKEHRHVLLTAWHDRFAG